MQDTRKNVLPVQWLIEDRFGRIVLGALVWTGFGILFALPYMYESGLHKALPALFNGWLMWLTTPAITAVDRHLPFTPKQIASRSAALVLFIVVVAAPVYVCVAAPLAYLIGLNDWYPFAYPQRLIEWYAWSVPIFCMVVAGLQAFKYYVRNLSDGQKMEQLQRHYLEARMNLLRMQLNPHFLFNTLNSISAQVQSDPESAQRIVGHLGDLLRLTLASKDTPEVTLLDEMAVLDHYLAIQKIRFSDRLRIEIHIEAEIQNALVPSLLLQPLVENAIRHGLMPKQEGGTLTVSANRRGSRVRIRITDDGIGLPPGWKLEKSHGIGLSATYERLLGLYPDGSGNLNIRPRIGGGTETIIFIPYHTDENIDIPAHWTGSAAPPIVSGHTRK